MFHRTRRLAPIALLLCACGTTAGPAPTTWTGTVTSVWPDLCVGRGGAAGGCFTGGPAARRTTLRVGECVSVTFTPHPRAVEGPQELTGLRTTSPTGHEGDCPPAP